MKKFVISSDNLKPALRKLSLAINTRSHLPVTKNIFLRISKDKVELIATDTELTVYYECPAETEGHPFEMLIPFDYLRDVVSLTGSGPLTIEHPSSRKAKLIAVNGEFKDEYELGSIDKFEDFPKIPFVPKANEITLDEKFETFLSRAMSSTINGDSSNPLTMACLDINKTQINLVSTDSQILFKHVIPASFKSTDRLLINAKAAKAIEGLGEMELHWSEKIISFVGNKVIITMIRSEAKYPDYRRVIPSYKPNCDVNRQDLMNALHKACLTSLANKQTVLYLKKTKGAIQLETEDPDFNRNGHTYVPCEYSGEVEKVTVNAKKMLLMMEQLDIEKIKLHIEDPEKAIVVTSEEDKDYLGLIIPFKS